MKGMICLIDTFLINNNYNYQKDISLKKYNTYRLDVIASYLVSPKNIKELIELLRYLKDNNIKHMILGNGSNIIFANDKYEGVIIRLEALNKITYDNNKVTAECGVPLIKLALDTINKGYEGAVVSVVDEPGDGFDESVNYDKLKEDKIVVAASPTPHAEVLKIAQDILKEKGVTLEIKEYTDYIIPNNIVETGEADANYFQHQPYLDDFNKQNKTHIVSVAAIHVEPMGIYGGKKDNLKKIVK